MAKFLFHLFFLILKAETILRCTKGIAFLAHYKPTTTLNKHPAMTWGNSVGSGAVLKARKSAQHCGCGLE